MEHNDGGPAFPDPGRAQSAKQRELLGNPGMSLRDFFAIHALSVVAIGQYEPGGDCLPFRNFEAAARDAYELADAMLKVRGAQP